MFKSKKPINIFLATLMIMAASLYPGSNSQGMPGNTELVKVLSNHKDRHSMLNVADTLDQNVSTDEEWKTFRNNSETKIRSNEMRIAEITVQLNKPGTTLDSLFVKRIKSLEQQNKDLLARLVAYQKDKNDWEKFKREFNRDMDELEKGLNDLTIGNNK